MFKRIIMLMFVMSFLVASNYPLAQNKDLAPIKLDLPKPMFVGTPTNLAVPNLEKPLGKPRPPFYAPKGTQNIALKKPVTSTDKYPVIGEISYITDGKKDAAEGYFVELGFSKYSY